MGCRSHIGQTRDTHKPEDIERLTRILFRFCGLFGASGSGEVEQRPVTCKPGVLEDALAEEVNSAPFQAGLRRGTGPKFGACIHNRWSSVVLLAIHGGVMPLTVILPFYSISPLQYCFLLSIVYFATVLSACLVRVMFGIMYTEHSE